MLRWLVNWLIDWLVGWLIHIHTKKKKRKIHSIEYIIYLNVYDYWYISYIQHSHTYTHTYIYIHSKSILSKCFFICKLYYRIPIDILILHLLLTYPKTQQISLCCSCIQKCLSISLLAIHTIHTLCVSSKN